jgi:hypothetical protein
MGYRDYQGPASGSCLDEPHQHFYIADETGGNKVRLNVASSEDLLQALHEYDPLWAQEIELFAESRRRRN